MDRRAAFTVCAHQSHDHTLNNRLFGAYFDRPILGILGDQHHAATVYPQSLDGCLALESGDYHIAIGRNRSLAHNDLIALQDSRVSHAIADHTEGEKRALSRPRRGNRDALLYVLIRNHGYTRDHAPHEWYACNRRTLFAKPKLTMSTGEFQIAFANQGAQMVADGAGRRPIKLGAKLAISRRGITLVCASAYSFQHPSLDCR